MSIHWFKPITVKQGEATLSTHRILLKNGDTGLVYKCSCCPCGSAWYVVTVCPCPNCGNVRAPFIGSTESVGGDVVTCDYGSYEDVPVKALTMADDASTTSGGKVTGWDCLTYPKGAILLAVRHTTRTAPFTGTVKAEVFIDGTKAADDWGPENITEGQTANIGDGVVGESVSTELFYVNHEFNEEGSYNADLRVTFSSSGGETQSYVCRASIKIVSMGTAFDLDPWIGTVAIIPETTGLDSLDCIIAGVISGTTTDVGMYLKVLKGPFDTFADADYVRTNFSGIIDAFADTCACDTACPVGFWAMDHIVDGLLSGPGGQGGGADSARCDTGWLEYDAVLNEEQATEDGYTITPTLIHPDGTESTAPWSGTLPPCTSLVFAISGVDEDHVFEEQPVFGNGFWPLEPYAKCCLDDEESPYYEAAWDYDTETNEGVPNNSDELADYKASLIV